jgi:hypothetical protein
MTPVIAPREPPYGASVTDDLAALMPPSTRENRESGHLARARALLRDTFRAMMIGNRRP